MADNTSYYLYQKYEKRGEQDPIPCYPNVYSVDGEGTKPLVIKSSADTECGAEDFITNWFAVSSYCVGVSKYETQEKGISYDNGDTWIYTGEYRDEMVEPYSEECGYIPPPPQYRTISGTPYCNQYNKYVDVYSQVSYDGGINWYTTSSASTLVEADSEDCGVIYRWQPSGTTCVGYDKWEQSIKQKSYDNGITWSNVVPLETSATTLIEEHSEDCGYSPIYRWVRTNNTVCIDLFKFKVDFINGNSYSAQCNNQDIISSGETHSLAQPISAITSLEVGNCVREIGTLSFGGDIWDYGSPASSLSSVTLSNSVKTIAEWSFLNCHRLANINFGESIEDIGNSAFEECGFSDITIPNSVKHIYEGAFQDCSGLTSVTINATNVEIDTDAFSYSNVKRVNSNTDGVYNIPSGVKRISPEAFAASLLWRRGGNQYLNTLNISSGTSGIGLDSIVETANGNPFAWCYNLSSIIVDSNNQSYNSNGNCNAIIETATNNLVSGCKNTSIPNSVTKIGNESFGGSTGLTSINIPSSVTSIGRSAFAYCSSLTNVTIPDSVTILDSSSFNSCTSITSVTIGSGVRSIGSSAFAFCSGLTNVTIPDSVEVLCGETFFRCTNITNVEIGSGLRDFGWPADFGGCTSLVSVTLHAIIPPTLFVETWPFPSGCILYVPSESLETYRNWSPTYIANADKIQPIP